MAEQPFNVLVTGPGPLLGAAERIVVDAHRRWHEKRTSTPWSPPIAYRWLRFEDPDPVARLLEGARRLSDQVELDEVTVAGLIDLALQLGYREQPGGDAQRT